jgi:hypothetical protein
MKMEQTEYSEMSAYKIQTPGNYPEESIQHSEHGESLKSRVNLCLWDYGLYIVRPKSKNWFGVKNVREFIESTFIAPC